MVTLLNITLNENGQLAVETDYNFENLNATELVPALERELTFAQPEVLEIVDFLTLASMGAFTRLGGAYFKRPMRLRELKSQNPELKEALAQWRRDKAKEMGVSNYWIIQNAVLVEISNTIPTNDEELLNIKGFGPRKLELYGQEILDITLQYRASQN